MLTSKFYLAFVLIAVISYLLGSLNFALILSRQLAGDDIRRHGSGNAGMTNVLRTYGKKMAAATAAGDFVKAMVAIGLSRYIFIRLGITILDAGYPSGLFVILGHQFPLYFGFKGGKAVIVSLAVIVLTNPLVFLIIMVVFVPFVFMVKIVSLASVLGAVAYPVLTWAVLTWMGRDARYDTICAAVIGAIILFNHRQNIGRLLKGTENKFGSKKN